MCPITSPIQEDWQLLPFFFFFFLLLLFGVNIKRGGRSGFNIILSTNQSIQVCCAGVEGEEAEGWSGMAIVLTAENKGPDNRPSLTTSAGLIWIFSLGWLPSYLQQLSQSYALNLAVCCLVANELWRCLVITAAVSLPLSPPFYHSLIDLKSLTETPSGCVLRLPPSLFCSFSCYLFGTETVKYLHSLFWSMFTNAHLSPPLPIDFKPTGYW